jgi:hypothetical protein
MPLGRSDWIFATSERTSRITSKEFEFGSTHTPMNTAVCPENRTSVP